MNNTRYILKISCPDVKGIVAAVSQTLFENDGFILESAQYGDPVTCRFFLRMRFEITNNITELNLRATMEKMARRFSMEWELHNTNKKSRVLLMVSRESHCLNDLLHRKRTGRLPIEVPAIISNHREMEEMAEWYRIPYHYLPVTSETKAQQEQEILRLIEYYNIDLVVLARYMQILSASMCQKLRGKAINIHHSFLPSFKGAKPYHQAYNKGVKLIGATAHYVTDDLDEGPIIDQEVIRVDHTHLPEQLTSLGCDVECRTLSRAVTYHIEHRVLLNGNRTVIFS